MRFRGIALLMHHGANINKVETDVDTSNALFNADGIRGSEAGRVMDGAQRGVADKVSHELDNMVDSEGIVYPAGARAGVE